MQVCAPGNLAEQEERRPPRWYNNTVTPLICDYTVHLTKTNITTVILFRLATQHISEKWNRDHGKKNVSLTISACYI